MRAYRRPYGVASMEHTIPPASIQAVIPDDIDLNSLRTQLEADSVAIGQVGKAYPTLESELIGVTKHATDTGFGKTGIVVLDAVPDTPTAVRDIAQDLLDSTDFSTIIVRSPGPGSVVSHDHSRAALESAQWYFLADPDIAGGSRRLIDTVNATSYSWGAANVTIFVAIVVAIVLVAWFTLRDNLTRV